MTRTRYISVLALTIALQLYAGSHAHATSSTVITANVCSADSTASLVVSEPSDGATVTTMPFKIRGSSSLVSQIRVLIDGAYIQTVPLNAGATDFAFDISVSPEGHHNVRLESFDICGRTAPVSEFGLDYLPQAQVATGSGDIAGSGGEVVGSETHNFPLTPIPDAAPKDGLPALVAPIIHGLGGVGSTVLKALDITSASSEEQTPKMVARFGLATAGFGAVLFTPAINYALAQTVAHISTQVASPMVSSVLNSPRFKFGLRCLGLGLIALAFMI